MASAVRFNSDGDLIVAPNITSVTIKLVIKRVSDDLNYGFALAALDLTADNKSVSWEDISATPGGNWDKTNIVLSNTGTADKKYNVSYKKYQFSFVSGGSLSGTSPSEKSDSKIIFYDSDGNDTNGTVELTITSGPTYGGSPPPPPPSGGGEVVDGGSVGPTSCTPGPWSPAIPSCGSPPPGTSSQGGLQITKSGSSNIILNLKNYVGKLVTLRITHECAAGWTQGFSFDIPTCSDIDPSSGTSGAPYQKSSYSNPAISGTNVWYVYNIDGGDYNYTFTHTSVPGPVPTRTNYTLVETPVTSVSGNPPVTTVTTVRSCVPYTETYAGSWPPCTTEVVVSKNGGDRVQWQYEDGYDGNYTDQLVTVEVVSVRDVVPTTGPVCSSALKNSAWFPDPGDTSANGNCISDYRDHSDKVRFRIPELAVSKTTLPDPVCFSDFRGIAGASPPDSPLGYTSGEYSILHIFDSTRNQTTSIVSGTGIIATPENESDTYNSPFGEANPSINPDLGTLSRRYYSLSFTDGTIVAPDASNVSISIGQNLTADGRSAALSVFKKEQGALPNSLRVWFYTSGQEGEQMTDDLIHVFDDNTNTTNPTTSILSSPSITVTPQSLTDPGGGTIDSISKKHYDVTFLDSTIVDSTASNIEVLVNRNQDANGAIYPVRVSAKQRVNDKTVRVWFRSYLEAVLQTSLDANHVFDNATNTTNASLSVLSSSAVTITPQSIADPDFNTPLNTTSRKHYTVTFNDATIIDSTMSNVTFTINQNLTANGDSRTITIANKERISDKSMRIWFYAGLDFASNITHVFNDTTNQTDTTASTLSTPYVTITPQNLADADGSTPLNTLSRKYYTVTFNDSTIINSTMSNIQITVNQNLTASGVTRPVSLSSTQRVDDKTMRVWFIANDGTSDSNSFVRNWTVTSLNRPANSFVRDWVVSAETTNGALDNTFARDWSVSRVRNINYSGNVFARNWYLSVV